MQHRSEFTARRPVRRATGFFSTAVIAAVLIAGCGNGDDDANGADITPATSPVASPTATTDPGPNGTVPGDDAERAQQSIRDMIEAYNAGEVEVFLEGWTENGLQAEFGATAEQIRANPEVFFAGPPGGIQIGDFRETDISDEGASVEFEFVFGRMLTLQRYDMVSQDGALLIDATSEVPIDIPEDVEAVSVTQTEFAFELDASAIGDGNIAFAVENQGSQPHEFVMLQVPPGLTVEDLLAIQGQELPEDIELVGSIGPFAPGAGGNMVFSAPLTEGQYLILCFLPDEEDAQGTPHLPQGMEETFQVPAP